MKNTSCAQCRSCTVVAVAWTGVRPLGDLDLRYALMNTVLWKGLRITCSMDVSHSRGGRYSNQGTM